VGGTAARPTFYRKYRRQLWTALAASVLVLVGVLVVALLRANQNGAPPVCYTVPSSSGGPATQLCSNPVEGNAPLSFDNIAKVLVALSSLVGTVSGLLLAVGKLLDAIRKLRTSKQPAK
jgi:hypothetical protein